MWPYSDFFPSGFEFLADIDDCSADPCATGNVCIDDIDSFTCVCQAGYTGDDCSTGWIFFSFCLFLAVVVFSYGAHAKFA